MLKFYVTDRVRNKKKAQQQNGIHTVSEHGSVGSHDTGIDSNPDDVCADHAATANSNSSYFKEMKPPPNDANATSDVDNDSTTVYDDDVGHHVADADDESDESVAKDTLNSASRTKRASFEKTSAWVQQLKMLRDTSSADVAGLDSEGMKEGEGSKDHVLRHQVSSGLFRRLSSSVLLNGYMLLDEEERRARLSLSENDSEVLEDGDSSVRLHPEMSGSATYDKKPSEKKKSLDYTKLFSKKLIINAEETDFYQLRLLQDSVSYQDTVIRDRETKRFGAVTRVISFDSEVHKRCPGLCPGGCSGGCAGLQNAARRQSKAQKESTSVPMPRKEELRGGPVYQNEQTLNGRQHKLEVMSFGCRSCM